MKRTILNCLMLAGLCSACSSVGPDKEEELIIITDKGLDIDDDKKYQSPDDTPGTQPGAEEPPQDPPLETPKDIPVTGEEETDPLYIEDDCQDTVLFAGAKEIETPIVVKQGGRLQMLEDRVMHDEATFTIHQGGYMSVDAYIQNVELTVEAGGTLNIGSSGAILLKGRKYLHLEPGAIILCDGKGMTNEGLRISTKLDDELSSRTEKLDSLEIQSMISY